ncbi:MAG: quinolinate synthase NadA, partial [Desulfonatronovibrionaceae bacterium]
MSSKDIHQEIERIRKKMGRDMVILGHHYQSDQIVRHTDIQGDSLELARKITALEARYIVFCGVHFMAGTAAVLAGSEQSVFLPDHGASCVMADTAPGELVQRILTRLNAQGKKIIPVAYVNSGLDIKELCGEFGGS